MWRYVCSTGVKLRPCTSDVDNSIRTTYTTGIEYAEKMREVGMKNKVNPKEYKCTDYFNFEKYSYCDIEAKVVPKRMPQPSNKMSDEERKAKP